MEDIVWEQSKGLAFCASLRYACVIARCMVLVLYSVVPCEMYFRRFKTPNDTGEILV